MPISCQSLQKTIREYLRFDSLTHHQADMVKIAQTKKYFNNYFNFNNNETYSFNWLEGQTKFFLKKRQRIKHLTTKLRAENKSMQVLSPVMKREFEDLATRPRHIRNFSRSNKICKRLTKLCTFRIKIPKTHINKSKILNAISHIYFSISACYFCF